MNQDIALTKQRVPYEDEAVKEALTGIFSDIYKRGREITGFIREDIKNTHRSVVSRLYLQLDSCTETTVVVKQFNPNWLGVDAEDSIIAHEMLGKILSGKQVAPKLYGTVRDAEKRRYWIFMEDIGKDLVCGREDFENEEMKHCLGFVEQVAKIHMLFAEKKEEELQQVLRPLVMPPRSHADWRDRYETAIERAPHYIERIAQLGNCVWVNEMADPFTAILEHCRSIIDFLVSQPFVFGHWDMAPEENMVIGCEGRTPIYYFMDWDEVYFGPALDNLPFGDEQEKTKQLALVERYRERVRGSSFAPSGKEDCLRMYRYCRLMRAIYSVHFHAEHSIERRAETIRKVISVAIRLAKELKLQ